MPIAIHGNYMSWLFCPVHIGNTTLCPYNNPKVSTKTFKLSDAGKH